MPFLAIINNYPSLLLHNSYLINLRCPLSNPFPTMDFSLQLHLPLSCAQTPAHDSYVVYVLNCSKKCSKLLFIPRVRTCFGSRSFAVAAPTIWNSLPLAICSSGSTYSFRRQLKTFFYNLAFRPS